MLTFVDNNAETEVSGIQGADESKRLSDLTFSSEGASRNKAVESLAAIIGKELVNAETGIKAVINIAHRNKLVSAKAVGRSITNGFSAKQHFAVASRIDRTWEHANLAETRPDRNGDPNIVAVRRFTTPILLDGGPATAYITAKESVEHGNRIYSLELQEIKARSQQR